MTAWEPPGECRKSAESQHKPRLELVPWESVAEIAEVLTFGAEKYGANNWCRGARWGRYFAALCRHIFAWWSGQDKDPETGKSHLAHAGCCLLFLMEYQRNRWGSDDRFKEPDNQPFQKDDGLSDQPTQLQDHRSVDVRCDGVSTTFPVPGWTVSPVFETASDSHC